VSLNAAAIAVMVKQGMDAIGILAVAEALEVKKDRTGAERQARYRERNKVTRDVTRDIPPDGSPKENNQTPSLPPAEVSEPNGSSPQPRPWALPLGVSLQVWDDFKRNRQRKRLPNTETAWKAFNDDLKRVSSQTGIPPPKLIEQCTAKGWGAIYDPRDQRSERPDNPTAIAVQRLTGIGAHN
jgi:hypothetical protein